MLSISITQEDYARITKEEVEVTINGVPRMLRMRCPRYGGRAPKMLWHDGYRKQERVVKSVLLNAEGVTIDIIE